jgi:Zn-dependent hydrolases, including glyoxylases
MNNLARLIVPAVAMAAAVFVPQAASSQAAATAPGPVSAPLVSEIAQGTYIINEYGMDDMYLVVGEKRALLIDTGSGACDLKAIVAKYTKLPYDVALTHGHPDHAGGAGQFDTIYLHPADIDMAKAITQEGRIKYIGMMQNMPIGYKGVWDYEAAKANCKKYDKFPEVKPLANGQVFDLGGRTITTYVAPGHTPGEVVFIDDKSKILFSGDASNFNLNMTSPVSASLRCLIAIQKLYGTAWRQQYTGHVAYAGMLEVVSQDPKIMSDIIEAQRGVLRGDAKVQVIKDAFFGDRTVSVYGQAQVGFDPKQLWEPGEAHVVP